MWKDYFSIIPLDKKRLRSNEGRRRLPREYAKSRVQEEFGRRLWKRPVRQYNKPLLLLIPTHLAIHPRKINNNHELFETENKDSKKFHSRYGQKEVKVRVRSGRRWMFPAICISHERFVGRECPWRLETRLSIGNQRPQTNWAQPMREAFEVKMIYCH